MYWLRLSECDKGKNITFGILPSQNTYSGYDFLLSAAEEPTACAKLPARTDTPTPETAYATAQSPYLPKDANVTLACLLELRYHCGLFVIIDNAG